MSGLRTFLHDDTGGVTIDWVALTSGILLLGIVVVYSVFNNGVSGLVSKINSTLATVTPTGLSDGGSDSGTSGPGPMTLADGTVVPVGTIVDMVGDSITVLYDGNDGTIIAVAYNATGSSLPYGTTVASSTELRLPDGSIVSASDYGLI